MINKLTRGIFGLTSSRKGTLSLMMFFFALIPMTVLCYFGKIDGTAYAACMSAITVAVVAVFCHTQSQTDQMSMMPTSTSLPMPNLMPTPNSTPLSSPFGPPAQ